MKLISKGAEAYIYREDNRIHKIRKEKNYRIPELDLRLRKRRTKRECTALRKCVEHDIPAPRVVECSTYEIVMEYIEGVPLSKNLSESNLKLAGKLLGQLHSFNICHGDFAPTNLILREDTLYIIDFGLVEFSTYYEKKAADLAVMWSALKDGKLFSAFLEGYSEYDDSDKVVERFRKNLSRGRYKKRD